MPAVKLVAEAQLFMRRSGPTHAGSPSGDFDAVRLNNAWLVNFAAPRGTAFFGVLLDDRTYSTPALAAGLAQRHAREMDALCSPVCSSSNFVVERPLSYDSSDTDADSEEEMERAFHNSCERCNLLLPLVDIDRMSNLCV